MGEPEGESNEFLTYDIKTDIYDEKLDGLFVDYEYLPNNLKYKLISKGVTLDQLLIMNQNEILLLANNDESITSGLILLLRAINEYKIKIETEYKDNSIDNIITDDIQISISEPEINIIHNNSNNSINEIPKRYDIGDLTWVLPMDTLFTGVYVITFYLTATVYIHTLGYYSVKSNNNDNFWKIVSMTLTGINFISLSLYICVKYKMNILHSIVSSMVLICLSIIPMSIFTVVLFGSSIFRIISTSYAFGNILFTDRIDKIIPFQEDKELYSIFMKKLWYDHVVWHICDNKIYRYIISWVITCTLSLTSIALIIAYTNIATIAAILVTIIILINAILIGIFYKQYLTKYHVIMLMISGILFYIELTIGTILAIPMMLLLSTQKIIC